MKSKQPDTLKSSILGLKLVPAGAFDSWGNFTSKHLEQVVNADGDYRNDHGVSLSADIGMMRKPLDVSDMTLDWVQHTEDTLFGDLDRSERNLLYMVFVREMDRGEIASSLGWRLREVNKNLQNILSKLRGWSELKP